MNWSKAVTKIETVIYETLNFFWGNFAEHYNSSDIIIQNFQSALKNSKANHPYILFKINIELS